MKRASFLLGTVAAGILAAGCVGGPARSVNPLGHQSSHKDLATQEQFPLRSSPVKEVVDRVFEERYPGTVNWLYVWGKDRWFDLMDVAQWDISFGRGFGVNAHLTEFAQAGVNWWDGTSWGMRGRAWGVWTTDEADWGLGPFYWIEHERHPTWGTQSVFEHEYKYDGWDLFEPDPTNKANHHDWSQVGGYAHLFAVGAHASASPIEAVDFVAGLFPIGLIANVIGYHQPLPDIMGDDTHSKLEKQLREEKGLTD